MLYRVRRDGTDEIIDYLQVDSQLKEDESLPTKEGHRTITRVAGLKEAVLDGDKMVWDVWVK